MKHKNRIFKNIVHLVILGRWCRLVAKLFLTTKYHLIYESRKKMLRFQLCDKHGSTTVKTEFLSTPFKKATHNALRTINRKSRVNLAPGVVLCSLETNGTIQKLLICSDIFPFLYG